MKQSIVRALFVLTGIGAFATPSFATSILLDQCNTVGLCNQVMVTTTLQAGGIIDVMVTDVTGAPVSGLFGSSGNNHAFAFNVVNPDAGVTVNVLTPGFSYAGAGLAMAGPYGNFEFEIDGPGSGSSATLPLEFTVSRTGGFTNANQLFEANSDGFFFEAHVRNNDTGSTGWAAGSGDPITVTAVPEPGSMVLLGSGLLGLAGVVRRQAKK